jgi:GNAT superfamily N-acetyltransferase
MRSDQTMSEPGGRGGVLIREATPEDAEVIISLVIALATFERLPPPDEAARQRLIDDAFGSRRRFEIYLAEVEDRVAGYAFVFETYSTFLALPTLHLEDLFVLPEFRSRKVAYALMRHLARETLRRGCGRFEWSVLYWNSHAIAFYERLGAERKVEWQLYRLEGEGIERLAQAGEV